MSDRNEKLEEVHDEENSETPRSAMECDPPLTENAHQDNLNRIYNFLLDDPAEASEPKKIVQAAEGIQNMAIAHEIAFDQNFKIRKIEPENDSLFKKVKDILHKAYWDILANELSKNPPVYNQALQLLGEIKQSLDELLFPHNARTKENMNEVLDIVLIKQQAENGVLDFSHYAQYVISLMAKICAPIRDEKIAELKKCTDVVETFRGIMELLELMKLDLVNFTIKMYRPTIVASSVEYEKLKFAEFLKTQEDGLENTREWLLTHATTKPTSVNPSTIKEFTDFLLVEAYLDLLEFDCCPRAETLMLDEGRIIDLRNKISRLAINGSILLLLKPLPCLISDQHKNIIKEHVMVLLESVNSNKDLEAIIPNILVQVKADIEKAHQDSINNIESPETNNFLPILENQIKELSKPDHKVRQLVTSRVRQFLKSVLQSPLSQQIPSGLSLLEKELTDIAAQFVSLITRNKNVFNDYYTYIVSTALSEKPLNSDASTIESKT